MPAAQGASLMGRVTDVILQTAPARIPADALSLAPQTVSGSGDGLHPASAPGRRCARQEPPPHAAQRAAGTHARKEIDTRYDERTPNPPEIHPGLSIPPLKDIAPAGWLAPSRARDRPA